MTLIYIPRTVDDDELAFAGTVTENIETLELAKKRLDDETDNDEAYKLGWDAWLALDSQIDVLVVAMRHHGWLAVHDLEGHVAAFARDNLEVNA